MDEQGGGKASVASKYEATNMVAVDGAGIHGLPTLSMRHNVWYIQRPFVSNVPEVMVNSSLEFLKWGCVIT